MKYQVGIVILALALVAQTASADPAKLAKLTDEQKREIAFAIQILSETGSLSADENKCAQFDSDIIEELQRAGLLHGGRSQLMSICIGASK
jgi:hypothetical protein